MLRITFWEDLSKIKNNDSVKFDDTKKQTAYDDYLQQARQVANLLRTTFGKDNTFEKDKPITDKMLFPSSEHQGDESSS